MSTDLCRWLFLLFFLTTWTKYSDSKDIRVVCYYTNWSVYRPGTAKFSPQNINPYLCTHLVYAFGGFTKENTLKPFDKYQDIEKGGYAKFTGLKTYNKNLKTMLAIGGWNEGSSRFSPMVANSDRRKELIKNTVKFLRQNHFDGLDLDWEYPSFRDGGKSRDRDNYAQLVQELREEFERESEKTGRPRLLLTMAVPAGIEYINKGYDVPKLTKYLDWMNILSYDYHSAFEPAVNHHAPLYPLEEPSEYNYDTELNIDYTIQHYLEKGADPNKLVLGIPTYGRSYTLFNPDANEIGAPADGPGDMGEATRENGYLAYYEICEYIKAQDWEVVQPNPDAMGPYAYKDNQWVGYDDDAIARKKAQYVAENKLGGIMFWSIDNDDFRGSCHGKPYPIIEAAKEALMSAYGLTDENLVSPPAKPIKSKPRRRPQSSSKLSIDKSEDKEKKSSAESPRRRNRVKSKSERTETSSRPKLRRNDSRRTTTEGTVHSSLELVTPSYTTPAPPPTPDMGGEFKCEDEGFYPHPKDCKKYYWCLSGPGELGIIAHQFTCPAGLYFNKAADSCDYTRNVLCNKKLSKPTTTTTAATTSTTTSTSTKRATPKITAATSRTTVFRTTTTTEAYEDEYEYEDEEEEEEGTRNAEEDPKVIKELLDLIKKAGGIEELEKQLRIHEDGSASVSHPDATTPSSISKSLVERVLGKAAKNKNIGKKNTYSFLNRNSRGPQNEGIETNEDKEKPERGRPQYTTITRQRAPKTDVEEEEEEEEESDEKEETPKKFTKKQPEYVNIRRGRVSSTTEEPEEDSRVQINRNKILGESDDEEEETDDEDNEQRIRKKYTTPQYVNIRRQRPSTTEETSTSKYTIIRRGTTTEADVLDELTDQKKRGSTTPGTDDASTDGKRRGTTIASSTEPSSTEKADAKSKYRILRRGSTTEPPVDESGSTSSSKRRGTTSPSVQDVSEKTQQSTSALPLGEKYKILKRGSTTEAPAAETPVDDSNSRSSPTPITSSTTQETDTKSTVNSETDNSVTDVDQVLHTSPESLTLKTTASISSTNLPLEQSTTGSILTDSSDGTDEGVYQTQTPQLLEPRPFSISTNDPTSSLKPVTESSTRVTKVSESNYKLRIRQKLPNTQTDIISTTTLTTEKPTPFRAPSRFKLTTPSQIDHQTSRPTIRPSVRARKRFSTTTELPIDNYEEYDLNRTYRPAELADLSSLTAVDFAAVKGLNRFGNPSRQRRPRPTTVTKATITTEKPEESLKTGSRTLPLARKLLDGTTFGKTRRVLPSKNEPVVEDQINSSSDTTHKIRPFTRAPPVIVSSTEETTRQTLRNRKIIRRLRPTAGSKLQPNSSDNNNNQIVFKKHLVRPSSTPATEAENLIEKASSNSLFSRRFPRPSTTTTIAEEVNKLSTTTETSTKITTTLPKEDDEQNETSDDVSGEEGENIKLSESNIRENSNVNNDNVLNAEDGKKIRRKVLKRIKSKVDDEKVTTEPNIVIRTRKIIRKLRPTEATITTTSTTESLEASTQGRKRKIIRRLRPTTASTSSPEEATLFIRGRPFSTHLNPEKSGDSEEADESHEEIESPIGKINRELETTDSKSGAVKFKPNPFKSKYKSITRTTTPHESDDERYQEESKEDPKEHHLDKNKYKLFSKTTTKSPEADVSLHRTIDRSRYSTINRGTTSTTENYDRDEDNHDKENQEEDLDQQSKPKYRIYKPTIFHDEDDDETVEESDEDTKSPLYRLLNPVLSTTETEKSEETTEDVLKIRILRPTEQTSDAENDTAGLDITTISNVKILNQSQEIHNETHDTEGNEKQSDSIQPTDPHVLEEHSEKAEEKIQDTKESGQIDENLDDEGGPNTEDGEEIVTTTVRNYVNPILTRQKNRPAFVRPKLTTQSPLRTSTVGKLKYKQFTRSSTSRPSRIHATTEEVQEDEHRELERKFIPKGRYSTRTEKTTESLLEEITQANINKTNDLPITSTEANNVSASTTTTEYSIVTEVDGITTLVSANHTETSTAALVEDDSSKENLTATELSTDIAPTTYEYIDVNHSTAYSENTTASYEPNVTLDDDNTLSSTEVYNTTAEEIPTPEITTLRPNDFTTVKNIAEEIANGTTANYNDTGSVSTEVTPIDTTLVHQYQSTSNEDQISETTTAEYIETSTVNHNTTTETTPVYHPKSTLRSILSRPKYNVPKRLISTDSSTVSSAVRPSRRFNQRNRGQTTRSRLITPSSRSTTPSSPVKNRLLFRYSTTERNRYITREREEEVESQDLNEEIPEEEVEEVVDADDDEVEQPVYTPRPSTTIRSHPLNSKARISNKPEGYPLRKTTEAPKVNEDLSDIDTEAVKNRNKSLFSKKRKMNTPFAGHAQNHSSSSEEKSSTTTTESTTVSSTLTTTPLISESVTKPTQEFETTEYLTTLHHIFAETELVNDKTSTTTEVTTVSQSESGVNATKSKVERLIEVNRIVEVHEMNNTDAEKDSKVIDKVGVINRVTVVKVVDGNPSPQENEITETASENVTSSPTDTSDGSKVIASEIATVIPTEQPSERQDRKFEIYGDSKVFDYNGKDGQPHKGAEIIDGISMINVITPRPYYSTEASTISLEALFQSSDTTQKQNSIKPSGDDELLETGNSHYINVRVLGQDEKVNKDAKESQRVPKEDDYITMKAEVVEVTPKINRDVIKIVPIQVEMSRKLIYPSDFNLKVENGVPKVNFQIIKPENK